MKNFIMAESMVEIAIIRSIISYVSRTYKAYRKGTDPRVSKTVYPIPENIKVLLKGIVIECKGESVFNELDDLIQSPDRVKILEAANRKIFQDVKNEFSPRRFIKWFAVSVIISAELEARGFSKALDILQHDVHAAYVSYRKYDVFKNLGFRVK